MLVFAIGVWFVLMCIGSVKAAQLQIDDTTHYRIAELERRLNAWDGEKVIERLARVETIVESNNKIALSSLAIIIGMMVERLLRRPGNHNEHERREDDND